MDPLIQVSNLTYYHPGTDELQSPALREIDFSIERGEFIALIGANGSGKTTLARHLNALLTPTRGEVRVNGKDTRDRAAHPQIRADIGMVFQHPEDQIVATTIEEDVAFGPENLCRLPDVIREQVEKALAVVNMGEKRARQPHLLSAGQMQRVALAGVLAMQPRCIIFDEATAMLDPAGRRDVLEHMVELNRMGITIIFITHFIEEVTLAERVLLLKQGALAFDGKPDDLFDHVQLLHDSGVERPASVRFYETYPGLFPESVGSIGNVDQLLAAIPSYDGTMTTGGNGKVYAQQPNNKEIIIENLSHSYMLNTPLAQRSLEQVDLEIGKGASHGLVGGTGSGKSTLLQHLNGLYRPQQGRVQVGPYDLNDPELDVKALRRYTGLVFQNPELYFFEQYVGDEIAFGPRMHHGTDGLRERVKWAMKMVGLDFYAFKDRIVSTLSGGEQRKVALASTLATNPSILILDEPTAGLDPCSRRNLLYNLQQMHNEGVQIILSSHNMNDIAEMVQALTVLSDGHSLFSLPVEEAFLDEDVILGAGLEQPFSIRLAQTLRKKGWPISKSAVKLESVEREVSRALQGGGS